MKGVVNVLVSLLFLGVGSSGCFGGSDDDELPDQGDDEGGGITAMISVLANGTALEAQNGSLPSFTNVNLTFDGSASNGTNLSYAWDFGDGGNGTNATEIYAYAAPGLFNATLTVSIGNNSHTASVTLNISVSGPQPGDLVWTDKKDFSGSLTVGNPNAPSQSGVDYRDHAVTINATAPDGTPAMAKRVKIVLDGSGQAAVDLYLYWRNSAGTNLASTTGGGLDKTLSYEGDMPAGTYNVRVRFAVGAQATYTVTSEVDYVAT